MPADGSVLWTATGLRSSGHVGNRPARLPAKASSEFFKCSCFICHSRKYGLKCTVANCDIGERVWLANR
jgi:hypothetical protein